jgi:hypothetical protein
LGVVSKWRRRLRRAARLSAYAFALAIVVVLALFWGVHHFPWLGPALADGLRKVVGPAAVAKLEDWAYDLDDRWQRFRRTGEAPKSYWQVDDTPPPPPAVPTEAGAALPPFHPADVGGMTLHAQGDGRWVGVTTEGDEGRPLAWKTLLHPDATRAWAEVFVVAIDVRRVRMRLVAGSADPEASTPEGKAYKRPAVVPEADRGALIAAFNGGWKSDHGHFGMKVDGVVLLPPRDTSCTVTVTDDEIIEIAPWTDLAPAEPHLLFYRQTPPCLYRSGKRHPGLVDADTKNWGAAIGGEAVIRRSAIGLDEHGEVLYVAVTNNTTAPALADAMHHAGAFDVAELDVNWSFPKFLVYKKNAAGDLEASTLFPNFVFDKDEFVRKRAPKDFFYLVRASAKASGSTSPK